jgi:hypothetical protein
MRIAELEISPLFELYLVLEYLGTQGRSVPHVAGLPIKIANCFGVLEYWSSEIPNNKSQISNKSQ